MTDPKGILFAILAGVCASLVGVLATAGMHRKVDPILATAVRSVVMMAACVGVALAMGLGRQLSAVRGRAITMIVLSGLAGAASWIFGYIAYDRIGVAKTSPLDKLSVPLGILLAVIFLGERPSWVNWVGVGLIVVGAWLSAVKK